MMTVMMTIMMRVMMMNDVRGMHFPAMILEFGVGGASKNTVGNRIC